MVSVFISYGRADDEPFACRLRDTLGNEGFEVWWDRESMQSRGRSFLQEIRDAIESSDRLLLVVGPRALASDYVRAEWNHALLFGKVVVCVLREGGFESIPTELGKLHTVDFRPKRDPDAALRELTRVLAEPTPALGPFRTRVPSLPPRFLPRVADLERVKELVLVDLQRPVVVSAAGQTVVVNGMAGAGKSVLAAAFARATETRRAFGDGVAWLTVGIEPRLAEVFRLLGQAFDDDLGSYGTETSAAARLPKLLADRVVLLVLDDVWNVDHVAPIRDALGPRCRLLITTRDREIATALGAEEVRVTELDEANALALLADWAGIETAALPDVVRAIAAECGYLPFALAICGAMARDGQPWEDLLDALHDADLAFLERRFPNYPYQSLLRSLAVSVDALEQESPDDVTAYRELAVFPADESVPEAAVTLLWTSGGGRKPREARALLARLERRALVRLEGEPPRRHVSLHDLQHDFLRASVGDLRPLHERLLAAYADLCGGDWCEGPSDGYFHRRLVRHLDAAGRGAEAVALLWSFAWLHALNRTGDLQPYLEDVTHFPGEVDLGLVARAVRMSANALGLGAGQLPSQLLGRLAVYTDPDLVRMLDEATGFADEAWLRPRTPSLMPAGLPLVRAIVRDMQVVNRVAVDAEQRSIVCSDDGGAVRIWDVSDLLNVSKPLESRVVAGIEEWVTALAMHPTETLAAVGDENGNVRLVDVGRACVVGNAQVADVTVESLVWSATGTLVAGLTDGGLRRWTPDEGDVEELAPSGLASIAALAIARDGRLWAAGAGLAECDPETARREAVVLPFDDLLTALQLSPDERLLAVGSEGGGVALLELSGRRSTNVLREPRDESHLQVSSLVFTPDGAQLVSVAWDRMLRAWDLPGAKARRPIRAHAMGIYDADLLARGQWLATASKDSSIRVWDLTAWDDDAIRASESLERHDAGVVEALAVSEQLGLAATAAGDGSILLWQLEPPRLLRVLRDAAGVSAGESSLAFDERGARVLALAGRELWAWQVDSAAHPDGVRLGELRERDWQSLGAALVPGGRRIVDGGRLRATTGTLRTVRSLQCPAYVAQACSQDGETLVLLDSEGALRPYETARARELDPIGRLRLESDTFWAYTLAPDLKAARVAVGLPGGSVEVWATGSRAPIARIQAHDEGVRALALSADGRLLASSAWDLALRVWDVESGRLMAQFLADEDIESCCFYRGARSILAGGVNGTVHFLEVVPPSVAGGARDATPTTARP